MSTNNPELIHGELCYEIIGAAIEVHNTLGGGFLEKVYENALCITLQERGIEYGQQIPLEVRFHGRPVGIYSADLLVGGVAIVEIKAAEAISDIHRAQVINYLKATGLRLGILINFAPKRLQWERLVL